MACGTPTLLARATSLPEIGGAAAAYFPPGDDAALAAEMVRMLEDPLWRSELIHLGLVRAKSFTWNEAAKKTIGAYGAALAS
jgi:alpha-1,3-rhamnosyl/mannosyltransferase